DGAHVIHLHAVNAAGCLLALVAIRPVEDQNEIRAHLLELVGDSRLGALQDGDHHNDGADTDDDAEHGQRGAELVGAQVCEGDLYAVPEVHGFLPARLWAFSAHVNRLARRAGVGRGPYLLPHFQAGDNFNEVVATQPDRYLAGRRRFDLFAIFDGLGDDLNRRVRPISLDAVGGHAQDVAAAGHDDRAARAHAGLEARIGVVNLTLDREADDVLIVSTAPTASVIPSAAGGPRRGGVGGRSDLADVAGKQGAALGIYRHLGQQAAPHFGDIHLIDIDLDQHCGQVRVLKDRRAGGEGRDTGSDQLALFDVAVGYQARHRRHQPGIALIDQPLVKLVLYLLDVSSGDSDLILAHFILRFPGAHRGKLGLRLPVGGTRAFQFTPLSGGQDIGPGLGQRRLHLAHLTQSAGNLAARVGLFERIGLIDPVQPLFRLAQMRGGDLRLRLRGLHDLLRDEALSQQLLLPAN